MGRFIDRTGFVYGDLVVVKRALPRLYSDGRPIPDTFWECRCTCTATGQECGNLVFATSGSLVSGNTKGCKRCGYLKNTVARMRGDRKNSSGYPTGAMEVYHSYRGGAKRRGLEFLLSRDQLFTLSQQSCWYCGRSHVNSRRLFGDRQFKYNGIDRLDNTKGYVSDNCVPCCGPCNDMKGTLSHEEFMSLIHRISTYWTDRRAVA